MHERSIVQALIEQIADEMQARGLHDVTEVRIEIGEFSGLEPALLSLAFAEMSSSHWNRDVQLHLDVVPLTARCRHCAAEFHVERFRFICPICNHAGVDVIAGEELRLISLIAAGSTTVEGAAT